MSYMSTDEIIVFPSARRGATQADARQLTESSLIRIINNLVDTDGFVITSSDDYKSTKPLEFNIHGYYFKVSQASKILELFDTSSSLYIYANIKLVESGNFMELSGQDEDSEYKGLSFTGVKESGDNVYSLLLFTRDSTSSSWSIPSSSRLKFLEESTSIDYSNGIDGGEL